MRASSATIGLDHVHLPVAVDPSPEPGEERQKPLIFDSQRMNLKNRVGTCRNAGALGTTTCGMVAALAPGPIDRRDEKTRLLLFSQLRENHRCAGHLRGGKHR